VGYLGRVRRAYTSTKHTHALKKKKSEDREIAAALLETKSESRRKKRKERKGAVPLVLPQLCCIYTGAERGKATDTTATKETAVHRHEKRK
jgi:hypothetical protein